MSDHRLLVDDVAVVTGGAKHGAVVSTADIDNDDASAVAWTIIDAGGEAIAVTTDVCNPADVERLRARVVDGHGRRDVLVNNAGGWVAVKDLVQGDPVACGVAP